MVLTSTLTAMTIVSAAAPAVESAFCNKLWTIDYDTAGKCARAGDSIAPDNSWLDEAGGTERMLYAQRLPTTCRWDLMTCYRLKSECWELTQVFL